MQVHVTDVSAVLQHLPPVEQAKAFRFLERRAQRNPRFRDRLDAAKARAEKDARDYDEWLCQQERERELAEDVAW